MYLFSDTSKSASWLPPKSRERKNREVDRCDCQTGLREECEIRVLLRETRGRFKDGNIFCRRTIFTFAYITFYVYTLRRAAYILRHILFILYARGELWERNIGIGEINDFNIAAVIRQGDPFPVTTVTNSSVRMHLTLLLFCPISSSRL